MAAGSRVIKCLNGGVVIKEHLSVGLIHRLIGTLAGSDIIVNLKAGAVVHMSAVLAVCIALDLPVSIGSGTDSLRL